MTYPKSVFLFGALARPKAMEILGVSNPRPARVPGARIFAGSGTPFETAGPGEGDLEGVVADADDAGVSRLGWLADLLNHPTRNVKTTAGEATLFGWQAGGGADWDWRDLGAEVLPELFAYYPEVSGPRMRALTKIVIGRVASRQAALASPAKVTLRRGAGRGAVREGTSKRMHQGFFHLQDITLTHPRFGGGVQTVRRETFIGTDATLVLPFDPVLNKVVLIEQFRVGPYCRGDRMPWMLEPIAGLIDPGESAETTAIREAAEEANVTVEELVALPGGYPSPGATAEFFHMFIGLCDLSTYRPGLAGLREEGEDILSHLVSLQDGIALLESGEAPVVPLALMLTWAAWKREELRSIELRRRDG